MQREIGICLWTLGISDMDEQCHLAKELGVDGVEIIGDVTMPPSLVKDILKKHNLSVLSVTPENKDISSENEAVRLEAVNYFKALLSWASEIDAPRICLHGEVGKVAGSGDEALDWSLLVQSTKEIMTEASKYEMPVVFELLNRYENHQMNRVVEGLALVEEVDSPLLSLLLDAYHMNIEEPNPVRSIEQAGRHLGVYHLADSNREGMGRGHSQLIEQVSMLDRIGYTGPIIMEMSADGPDPFTPIKRGDYVERVLFFYRDTLEKLAVRLTE